MAVIPANMVNSMSAVRIAFEIPSAFREITPGLNARQACAEVMTHAAAQGSDLPVDRLEEIAAEYEKTSAMLASSGVRYCATCFGQFHDEWSMGTVAIALTPLTYRDTEIAVAGITRILAAEHGRSAEVSTITLPCGQATLVIRQPAALRLPGEFTASGTDIPLEVAQLQVSVPVPQSAVPGAQTLVTVTFSTPSTDHWPDYCELLVPFLRSLRFLPDPAADGRTAEVRPAPSARAGSVPAFG